MIIKYAIALAIVVILCRRRRLGVPARPVPARQPGPAPADPAAPAAAPGQGLRPRLQPVAALGPPGRPAPLRPDPPLASAVVPDRRTPASTRCSSAGPTTGTGCTSRWKSTCWSWPRPAPTRPRSWPTSSCATPARSSPPAPNPTCTQLTSRGARPARPGARVQPAAHRRRPLHLLLVPGRRLRGPGHRHPPRRRVRVRRLAEGRRGRHVLVRQSQRLPARLLPRRRPGPLRPAHGRRLGVRRRPGRPRADPARRRRPPVGADPGRAPVRGPQDRRHRPDGHVQGPGVHGRPRPGRLRSCPAPAAGSTSPPSSPTAAPCT